MCWMVVEHLNETSRKEHDSFKYSEWGPEAAGAMAQAVRDFPIVNGGKSGMTMGHLIDKTDKNLISKVVLEEKVYKAWYGGRTVLLGDGKEERLNDSTTCNSENMKMCLTIRFCFTNFIGLNQLAIR